MKENNREKNNKGCLRGDFKDIANVRHLTRVFNYLNENGEAYKNKIINELGMNGRTLKSALNFLVNYKIVLVIKTQKMGRWEGVKYYDINPLFKNIKGELLTT